MLYLGIDSGTQSTKTVVLDFDTGRIIASAQSAYGLIDGLPPGHMEQDPQVWLEAVTNTVLTCLGKVGDRKDEIRGIGVSGQQHGLVVLDKKNRPIRPAKLWCDTSTSAQCEQIAQEFGGDKGLVELTGNAMLPGYTAPKILWLKQNEPSHYKDTRSILLPHDYINFHLTGEKQMEYGDASGTGLLDVRERKWCRKVMTFIDEGLEDRLPPLESSKTPVGLLRDSVCKEWGLKQSPLVSAGGGDNMMGAIGTGNIRAGITTASLGTSGTLYAYSEKPVIDSDGEVAAFCDSTDHWLPLVCTMNVTVATESVREMFGWDHDQLEEAVASSPPGADGLVFLPYLNGERTPNMPNAKGVLHGLTTSNMTPQNIARAAMEGATLGLAYGLGRFSELGVQPREIRLTGGGSKSPAWRQIVADIFGAPTICLQTSEGAALGAAMQACWISHLVENKPMSLARVSEHVVKLDESTRAEPNAKLRDFYRDLLGRHGSLTRRLHSGSFI